MATDYTKNSNTKVAEMVREKAMATTTIGERVVGRESTTLNQAEAIQALAPVHFTQPQVVLGQMSTMQAPDIDTAHHKNRFQFIHQEVPLGHTWATLTCRGLDHYVILCMRTDPSAIRRDPKSFEQEVIPLFQTC